MALFHLLFPALIMDFFVWGFYESMVAWDGIAVSAARLPGLKSPREFGSEHQVSWRMIKCGDKSERKSPLCDYQVKFTATLKE